MANVSIFGSATPSGLATHNEDTNQFTAATAFYITSGSNVNTITGVRFWLGVDSNAGTTGYKAFIWQGADASTATLLTQADFTGVTKGAWNEVILGEPQALTVGQIYWAAVYFPDGCYPAQSNVFTTAVTGSDVDSKLYAAGVSEVSPGNATWVYGGAGAPTNPINNGAGTWYGVDVLVAGVEVTEMTATIADSVSLNDSLTAVRAGGSSEVSLQAVARDELGATSTANLTMTASGSSMNVVPCSLMGNRISFGPPTDGTNPGPTLRTDTDPYELGVSFWVQKGMRITGARIYKAPLAAGTIPVTLWDGAAGTSLGTVNTTWVSDGGGWRTIKFASPITVVPDKEYILSYYAVNMQYAAEPWVYNGQDVVEPPFVVKGFTTLAGVDMNGSAFRQGSHGFPNKHYASMYWIDVLGEFDNNLPQATQGYMQQWTGYTPAHDFPVAIFYSDPEWFVGYEAIGINTIVGFPATSSGYRDAILATSLDLWPNGEGTATVQTLLSDSSVASHIVGWFLNDEPDLAWTRVDPQTVRNVVANIRKADSTRPTMMNFGTGVAVGAGWTFLQPGQTINQLYADVLEWCQITDVVSLDHYNLSPGASQGRWGVWTYYSLTNRLHQFSAQQRPVWGYVETTGQEVGYPLPADVEKATWAHLIAGAKGIVFFDHRFAGSGVTQDFATILHNEPMKIMVQALTTEIQALAPALLADEANLITSVTSSNTSAGPYGGTFGVPIISTSRKLGGSAYIIAMGNRPGATTGTFTVPSAAGKTLTVRGEDRTVTANGSGVFTDTFAADYTVHRYEWDV